MSTLNGLADALFITEERENQMSLKTKRLTVKHSITLHRDSTSVADIEEMIRHLRASGMPGVASLRVTTTNNHTQLYASWADESEEATR